MDLRILGFRYKNIRQFADLTIDLTGGGVEKGCFPISLIQMPNGMGKTTTMELLRHCLTGDLAQDGQEIDPALIRGFSCFVNKAPRGEFELRLLVDGSPLFITLVLDYDKGKASYFTAKVATAGGGRAAGWNLPEVLRTRFSEAFVRLFVFDGELAKELRNLGRDEAEKAIKALYYLDKLGAIKDKVVPRILERRQQKALTNITTAQAEKALRTQLKEAERVLATHRAEEKRSTAQQAKARTTGQEIQAKIDAIIAKNEQALKTKEEQDNRCEELEKKLTARTIELLDQLRQPQNLSLSMASQLKTLAELMGRLRLPRTESAEFFHELAQQPDCLCGRPLEDPHREHIRRKAAEFLSQDEIGVVNAIKSSIRNLPPGSDVSKTCQEIATMDQDLQRAQQLLDQLAQKLNREDQVAVEELVKQREGAGAEETAAAEALSTLLEKDKVEQEKLGLTWENNLPLCIAWVEELKARLADATQTVVFYQKSKAFQAFIDQVIATSLTTLKEGIRLETNKKVQRFLGKADVFVESIGSGLKISGREDVSQGQSLAIAYAFLSSLFSESPHRLPFVVDSPVGAMDIEVRREVARVIPDMFPQLVVFIISSERQGFVEKISGRTGVQYLTVYENPKGSGRVVSSPDPKVFNSFHSEEEVKPHGV